MTPSPNEMRYLKIESMLHNAGGLNIASHSVLGLISAERLCLLLPLRYHFASIAFSCTIHTEQWQMSANIKANHRERKCKRSV